MPNKMNILIERKSLIEADHYDNLTSILIRLDKYVCRKNCLDEPFSNLIKQFNFLFDAVEALKNDEESSSEITDSNDWNQNDNDWDWDIPESTATINRRRYQSLYRDIKKSYEKFNETNDWLDHITTCEFQKELINNLISIDFGETEYSNQFDDIHKMLKLLIEKKITSMKQLLDIRIDYRSSYDD